MTDGTRPRVIAIEEHYLDPEVDAALGGQGGGDPRVREQLFDLGELRLRDMDAAGIDVQVLSHCPPGAQVFPAETGAEMARGVNDRLHDVVRAEPNRFAAFATLPTRNPQASADELARCVEDLGFRGAMVHGLTDETFIDDRRFWPIFERAAALDVPVYVHPGFPHPGVVKAYYGDYAEKYPGIMTAAWGFTVEIATSALRLVLSGVFAEYPNLKIILGHMGEGLPFSLWRINHAFEIFALPDVEPVCFREVFSEHFWITTSGNFSDPALLCSVMELGADRIIFSVDWPYIENAPGTQWAADLPLSAEDRHKILHGNAERLLKM